MNDDYERYSDGIEIDVEETEIKIPQLSEEEIQNMTEISESDDYDFRTCHNV